MLVILFNMFIHLYTYSSGEIVTGQPHSTSKFLKYGYPGGILYSTTFSYLWGSRNIICHADRIRKSSGAKKHDETSKKNPSRSSTIIKFIRHSTENYPKSSKILFNIICPYIKIFQETKPRVFFLDSNRRFLKCVAGSWAPHPKGAIASGSPALSAVPREVRPGHPLPSWVKQPHRTGRGNAPGMPGKVIPMDLLVIPTGSQNLTSTNFGWFFFHTNAVKQLTEPKQGPMRFCFNLYFSYVCSPKKIKGWSLDKWEKVGSKSWNSCRCKVSWGWILERPLVEPWLIMIDWIVHCCQKIFPVSVPHGY